MIGKRSLKRLAAVMACLMLAAVAIYISAAPAYAAENSEYKFVVKVYSGKEGHFADGSRVKSFTCSYGETLSLRVSDMGIVLEDPDTYYVRGLKIAGHDNDEFSQFVIHSYSYEVTGDEAFSVAYGLKGGMVKYTVRYEDESGNELLEPEEFYGMIGDRPVVSYRYVEGYTPNAYNLGRSLTENEEDNVFTFVYRRGESPQPGQNGPGGANAAPGGAGTGGGAANAANQAGANGDGNNGPANLADIGDGDVPLTDQDVPKADPSELAKQHNLSQILIWSAIIAGLLLLIVFIIAFLAKKRKEKEEAEEIEGNTDAGKVFGAK